MAGISSYIGQKRRLQLTRNDLITVLINPTVQVTSLNEATKDILENFGNQFFMIIQLLIILLYLMI